MAHVAQLNCVGGSNIDWPLVDLADCASANNVRSDGEDSFVLRVILRPLTKKVSQDWNLRQPGDSSQCPGLRIIQNAANQAGFAVFQADFVLDFLLADDRLADAADARLADHRRNF